MTNHQPPSAPPPPPPSTPYGQHYAAPSGEVPLWAPLYGASFGAAFVRFWKKYADFSGRASRSEYWWWALITFLVVVVLEVMAVALRAGTTSDSGTSVTIGPGGWIFLVFGTLWWLGALIPTLAILWRRLHDANLSGGFFFLSFVPFVGGIILLVLTLLPSNTEGARFDRPRG